jgi:hypothetical protein
MMRILPQGSATIVTTYTATRRKLWFRGNATLFAVYVQTKAVVPTLQVPDQVPCLPNAEGRTLCPREDLAAVAAYCSDLFITSILNFDATLVFRQALDERREHYHPDIEIVLELPIQEANILSLSGVTSKGFDWLLMLYALLGLLLLCCSSILLYSCRKVSKEDDELEEPDYDQGFDDPVEKDAFYDQDEDAQFGPRTSSQSRDSLGPSFKSYLSPDDNDGSSVDDNDNSDSSHNRAGGSSRSSANSTGRRGWKGINQHELPTFTKQRVSLKTPTIDDKDSSAFSYPGLSPIRHSRENKEEIMLYPGN